VVWAEVLALFPADSVELACARFGASDDPWPDVGKLLAAAEYYENEKRPTVKRGTQFGGTISHTTVKQVAAVLGMGQPE